MSNQNTKAERGSVISTILEVLRSGDKTGVVLKQPSLYSCLTRLENQGIITSYWTDSDIGGRRHYYKYNDENNMMLKDSNLDTTKSSINYVIENFDLEEIEMPIHTKQENTALDNISTPIISAISEPQSKNSSDNNNESNYDNLIILQQLIEKQSDNNIRLISGIKNNIRASQEVRRITEENQVITTPEATKVTTASNYKDILGEILYEKHDESQESTSDFAQQAFNFDNEEISVENDKKYVNNVLLKTASNKSSRNKQESNKNSRKYSEHFTNIGDLKNSLLERNIEVKEYSFVNYQFVNNKRYIKSKSYMLFSVLLFLIYCIVSIIYTKSYSIYSNFSSYFISLSAIQLFICLFSYQISLVDTKKYLRYNILVQLIITSFQVLLSTLIAFQANFELIFDFKPFIIMMFLLPFSLAFISLLFSKKAAKF